MNKRINIKTMKKIAAVPNTIIGTATGMNSPGCRGMLPAQGGGVTISVTCEKTMPRPPSVIAVVASAIAQAAPPILEGAGGGAVSTNGFVSIKFSPQRLQYLNPKVACA